MSSTPATCYLRTNTRQWLRFLVYAPGLEDPHTLKEIVAIAKASPLSFSRPFNGSGKPNHALSSLVNLGYYRKIGEGPHTSWARVKMGDPDSIDLEVLNAPLRPIDLLPEVGTPLIDLEADKMPIWAIRLEKKIDLILARLEAHK